MNKEQHKKNKQKICSRAGLKRQDNAKENPERFCEKFACGCSKNTKDYNANEINKKIMNRKASARRGLSFITS